MKAGVIGMGMMGKTHLQAMQKCGVEDLLACDMDEKNASCCIEPFKGTSYTNYAEMIAVEQPTFVSVCVPTTAHYAVSMGVLKEGVSVLCEKPFATTPEQADEMIQLAQESHSTLMVAHCLRFMKPYIYLKHCLEDGRFGRLLSLNMYRHSTEPLWSVGEWLKDIAASGGAAFDLHIHETDMAVFLFGKPQAVTTTGDYRQCASLYHYADDSIAVSAQASWRPVGGFPFSSGYDANFEGASVICQGDTMKVFVENQLMEDVLEREKYPEYIISEDAYVNEINYFLQVLRTNENPCCPLKESRQSLEAVKAEIQSFCSRKTIVL